jgi:hypothetical protein
MRSWFKAKRLSCAGTNSTVHSPSADVIRLSDQPVGNQLFLAITIGLTAITGLDRTKDSAG